MIAIIDYGLSNLLSIQRAAELFESRVIITNKPNDLKKADKIILPGVGAFQHGMECLKELGLDQAIYECTENNIPLLGICLGMQMLFHDSEEGGYYKGLGLIDGHVVRIPCTDIDGNRQDVPHIGWNILQKKENALEWPDILDGIDKEGEVYFVHSYEGKPANDINRVADTIYGGRQVCAIVQNKNVIGCQFHPEKSGDIGLNILKNFIKKF